MWTLRISLWMPKWHPAHLHTFAYPVHTLHTCPRQHDQINVDIECHNSVKVSCGGGGGHVVASHRPFTPIGNDATNQWCLTESIVSKQLMQQSRKSLLIQFGVTMCNVLREADMVRGVMSVGEFVQHQTCRTRNCELKINSYHDSHSYLCPRMWFSQC